MEVAVGLTAAALVVGRVVGLVVDAAPAGGVVEDGTLLERRACAGV